MGRIKNKPNPPSGEPKLIIITIIDSIIPMINKIDAIVFNIWTLDEVFCFSLFEFLFKYLPVKNNIQKEVIAEINQNQKSSLKFPFPNPIAKLEINNMAPTTNERIVSIFPITLIWALMEIYLYIFLSIIFHETKKMH